MNRNLVAAILLGALAVPTASLAQYPANYQPPYPPYGGGPNAPAPYGPPGYPPMPPGYGPPPMGNGYAPGAPQMPYPPSYGPGQPMMPCSYGPPPYAPPPPEAPPPPAGNSGGPEGPECVPGVNGHANLDYLYWFVKRQTIPILVTTGDPTDLIPGALGQPGTRSILGDIPMGFGRNGARLTLGTDFGTQEILAFDVTGFWLQQGSNSAFVSSDGSATSIVLSRPFFNVVTNQEDADPIAFPNLLSGFVNVALQTKFWGGEANFRYQLVESELTGCRINLLGGARLLTLDESLIVTASSTELPDPVFGGGGTRFDFSDSFSTTNRFFGGQLGIEVENHVGCAFLAAGAKMAVGLTSHTVNLRGATRITDPDGTVTVSDNSALLVQASNVGTHSNSTISVVPELNLNVGFNFNEYVRVVVGYTGLYWNGVVRPGDEVNRRVNIQAVGAPAVGPQEPLFPGFQLSSFWAQGLTASLQFTF